ncbi:alpha/beta fold hydrolase [Microlunatus sp. GCM10028923]|uniref:alpha/beta fold hydrolase n=1 Tax=Microlunatus sp. GCM10028923 TaxID=3273400 RepID=UPI00360DE6CF
MINFVLVHGAWYGSWGWQRVAPLLRQGGAEVHTTDLSPDPEAGLGRHADQVVDTVRRTDGDVVLVGHSYGGLVVRQAADRFPDRIRRLVLIDGWAGPDGASLFDLAPDTFRTAILALAERNDDPRLIPVPSPKLFGLTEPADIARLRPEPLRSFTEPSRLSGAVDAIPGTAIYCRPQTYPFDEFGRALGYRTVGVDGPHDLMAAVPTTIAALLLDDSGPVD